MHKKISVGLCLTIAIITLVVTAIITTAVTMNIYSGLVSDLPERENMYAGLVEIDSIIRKNYYGTAEEEIANDGISDGYLSSLTTGRNYHMTAAEYAEYKTVQSGKDADGNAVVTVEFQKFNNAGYIKISDFTDMTADEFSKAVTSLRNDGVSGLIIDVRNTDSINISAAAEIVDILVPLATEGTQSIATAVDKNNKNIQIFAADSESSDLPVSVIVNDKTAGAGELLACDIRDFGKGTVVGTTTAGNGTYQQIFELSDGSAVVLTVAKLLPYTSGCYDGTGIIPDYEVQPKGTPSELKDDVQFMRAYASVNTLIK